MLSHGGCIFSWHGVIWRLFTVDSLLLSLVDSWWVTPASYAYTCTLKPLKSDAFSHHSGTPLAVASSKLPCAERCWLNFDSLSVHMQRQGISCTNRIILAAFQKQTTDCKHLPWMYFFKQNQTLRMQNAVTQMFPVKLGFSFDSYMLLRNNFSVTNI